MSDTDTREDAHAANGESIAPSPITTDTTAASAKTQPANRIAESSFEATHADLPPLSAISGNDATTVETASSDTAANGVRRGRGRGASAGAAANTPKVAFGVVENPADLTESLSGKHAAGYGDSAPAREPREPRAPREERRPRENTPAAGPKEFVPPISQGTYKAELNPEAEQKAREERRRHDDRPRGEQRERDNRAPRQGGEFRGEPRRNDNNRRDEQRQRPGRLTIEAPKMPVQEPTGPFARFKRWIAEKIYGSPSAKKIEIDTVRRPKTPHSKDWQFDRNGDNRRGGDDRGRRDFRQGANGGDHNPNRDGRHRPHARGGNHHERRDHGGNRH